MMMMHHHSALPVLHHSMMAYAMTRFHRHAHAGRHVTTVHPMVHHHRGRTIVHGMSVTHSGGGHAVIHGTVFHLSDGWRADHSKCRDGNKFEADHVGTPSEPRLRISTVKRSQGGPRNTLAG